MRLLRRLRGSVLPAAVNVDKMRSSLSGLLLCVAKTVIADKRTGVVTNGNTCGAIPTLKCYVFLTR